MYIKIEQTPNPLTMKFLPGQEVLASGSRDFGSMDEASPSPLASALFSLNGVTGVFFGSDFVSVTISADQDWSSLKDDVMAVFLDHFASGAPLFSTGTAEGFTVPPEDTAPAFEDDPADAEIVAQIRDLLESRVRPAVAGDGGDIIYRGFSEGVVSVTMQGACSGCPSSAATLKQGIENLLRHYVPEVTEVRAV